MTFQMLMPKFDARDVEHNREVVLETPNAIPTLVASLSAKNPSVLITTCGALLNISMDNGKVGGTIESTNVILIIEFRASPDRGSVSRRVAQGVEFGAVEYGRQYGEALWRRWRCRDQAY